MLPKSGNVTSAWSFSHLSVDIRLVSEHGRIGRPHFYTSSSSTLAVPRTRTRFGDRSFAAAEPCLIIISRNI